MDFHLLLFAGLPAHYVMIRILNARLVESKAESGHLHAALAAGLSARRRGYDTVVVLKQSYEKGALEVLALIHIEKRAFNVRQPCVVGHGIPHDRL